MCIRDRLYNTLRAYREEIQEEVISNQGVIKCFDVGKEHQIVFARTLKDFKNVLREDQIIGTVMLTISPKYLTDALANTLVTPHGYAMLENKDGIISYSTKKADKGKYLEQTLPAGSEGQSWESLSVPIEALGQNLVIVTPREDISLTIGGFIKTLFLSVGILAMLNLILVPVSYTHLDVYKRQHSPLPSPSGGRRTGPFICVNQTHKPFALLYNTLLRLDTKKQMLRLSFFPGQHR